MDSTATRRELLAAIGAATVATAPAAAAQETPAGGWPQFGFDRQNTGYNPEASGPSGDVGAAWTFDTERQVKSTPVVVGDTVYVTGTDSRVYALDAESGTERWSQELGEPIRTTPTVRERRLYVGDDAGVVSALETATGRVVWQFETGGAVRSSPLVVEEQELVVVGSRDGRLYGIDIVEGEQAWVFPEPAGEDEGEGPDPPPVDTSPALIESEGLVCFGSDDTRLYALDIETGSIEWAFGTDGSPIRGSPAVGDGVVYVGGGPVDPRLYAIGATTGNERWREELGESVVTSPATAGGRVYVAVRDGSSSRIEAFERTGEPVWSFENGLELTAPVVADGTVFAGSRDGTLYAVEEGTQQFAIETPSALEAAPSVAGERLYVGGDGGTVYALAAGGDPLAPANPSNPDDGGGGLPDLSFLVWPASVMGFLGTILGGLYVAGRIGLLGRIEEAADAYGADPEDVEPNLPGDVDAEAPTEVWDLVVQDVIARSERTDRTATEDVLVSKYVDPDTLESPVVAYEIESYRDDTARVRLVEGLLGGGDQPLGNGWEQSDGSLVFETAIEPDERVRTMVGRPDCPEEQLEKLRGQPDTTVEDT